MKTIQMRIIPSKLAIQAGWIGLLFVWSAWLFFANNLFIVGYISLMAVGGIALFYAAGLARGWMVCFVEDDDDFKFVRNLAVVASSVLLTICWWKLAVNVQSGYLPIMATGLVVIKSSFIVLHLPVIQEGDMA